jgi:hypothetical protein
MTKQDVMNDVGKAGVALLGFSGALQEGLNDLAPLATANHPKIVATVAAVGGLVTFIGFVGHLAAKYAPTPPPAA